jgi:hypothetical protein
MKLQTQIPLIKKSENQLNCNSKILLLGSCFSENIGKRLDFYKFQTVQNPFGILFHPKAIENLITNAVKEKRYTENELTFNNERWHCLDAHSSASAIDKNEVLNNLNSAISVTNKKITTATHIIITLGTSWVYKYIETDKIVANCHKIPHKKFTKELLSVDEITKSLENSINAIQSINKHVSLLFTVSPVRHLKDGFIENTQSKAHLIAAIHNILEQKCAFYFPSYEIMMDELRDYRFYAEDMIHPNQTAINYIWEKFVAAWFLDDTKNIMKEVDAIQRGILHKPFNKNSEQHQQFLQNLEIKKKSIKTQFPFINFTE